MKTRIIIIKFDSGKLMVTCKALSPILKLSLTEVKSKLAALPYVFIVDESDKSQTIEVLETMSVEYQAIDIIDHFSEKEIDKQLLPSKIEDLEVRGSEGSYLIYEKGSNIAILMENEDLYRAIIKRILEISNQTPS